mmetsp:Transcript_66725/g.206346  ORF Transcript_66725/g.206346 Transcript_66725/m.206346 type:complete len:220 (-) Transcript_66725:45-704(-)
MHPCKQANTQTHTHGCTRAWGSLEPRRPSLLVPLAGVGRVGLRGDGLHHDGHEAVERAAELRALPVEDTLPLDEGVDAVDAARGRVGLNAQGWHRPAVEHVLPRHEEADVRARGEGQALVDLQVAHHAGLQVLVRHEVALELVERGDLGPLEVLLRGGVVLRLHVLELGAALLRAEALHSGCRLRCGHRARASRWPEEGLQRAEHRRGSRNLSMDGVQG